MNHTRLNQQLAAAIVQRTMSILNCNVNIMNAQGYIIASGDPSRIGDLHHGALHAISTQQEVYIEEISTGVFKAKPGVNMPLRVQQEIVGVIGVTGDPEHLKEYAKLVCMTAELMLEQADLFKILSQNARLREELVLKLIHEPSINEETAAWAKRLDIDLDLPRVACLIQIDSHGRDVDAIRQELLNLQELLVTPERGNLVAVLSLNELLVLKPALDADGRWNPESHIARIEQLITKANSHQKSHLRIALGQYFTTRQHNPVALSFRTAKTTLSVGKARYPKQRIYYYHDLQLPVLLNQLKDDWQNDELQLITQKLIANDKHGNLQKTVQAWFQHNMQLNATAQALFIHRNTLEYRLDKVASITGLNLGRFDDKVLLYIAMSLHMPTS